MSVLLLSGKKINWAKPPNSKDRVMWSSKDMYGRKVTGSFRTIAALDRLNTLAIKKFKTAIVVIQPSYNTGVKASAGTHDFDACLDVYIPGVAWRTQETFFRANGAGAYWRKPPLFGNHIHLFILPEPEGKVPADDYKMGGFKVGYLVDGGWTTLGRKKYSAQLDAYYNHRDALADNAVDHGWFPSNIHATVFDLHQYVRDQLGKPAPVKAPPAPVAKPKDEIVRFYEHRHLNTHGDDGATGTATVDKRRPAMIRDLTATKGGGFKPEVITLNEVRPVQVAGWRKAFKAAGYDVPLAEGGNLVAVLAGTLIDYAGSTYMSDSVQGEGRKEAVGRVRAFINGHWQHIMVSHLDYRQTAAMDLKRVQQAKWIIKFAKTFAKSRPLSAYMSNTSIALDENSPTWVRDKAFLPAGYDVGVKSGIDAIYSARAAMSTYKKVTESDHPVVGVTYGKKAA